MLIESLRLKLISDEQLASTSDRRVENFSLVIVYDFKGNNHGKFRQFSDELKQPTNHDQILSKSNEIKIQKIHF